MRTIIANTISNIESRIENQSMKELVLRSGGNTGNVCFVDALKAQMNYEEIISCYHIDKYDKKDKDTVFERKRNFTFIWHAFSRKHDGIVQWHTSIMD